MERTPGRYNLHRLGWKSFEDLVIEINRLLLGATVTPFRMGADGGRDGFFVGPVAGIYADVAPQARKVVFQCKHSSTSGDALKWADVSDELPKLERLAREGEVDLYVIFSNRRLAAEDEKTIRQKFEKVAGIQGCAVFGEEWIELHIDDNHKLLRRVPRLYGVGDLAQIISHNVSRQTRLILDERKAEQAVFVPTRSYREAVSAMETEKIVLLVGPPASGKSSIAANLCMVMGAEIEDLEVLKIETADQFVQSWAPQDARKLFWVDDFFGETTLDAARAKPWASVFDKVKAALASGCRFIFTCRDYILKDAHNHIRRGKLEFWESNEVVVRVDNLTDAERERILYNHVKLGDLDASQKRALKPYLEQLARLPSFTPEIARRIGTRRFHKNLQYDIFGLREFVEKPTHFFSEVIHDLGKAEKATIALLLLFGNSLTDPVAAIPAEIGEAYGVGVADIRGALEAMKGGLVKLDVIGRSRVWQVHHPSMIDAMHEHLREHPTMLDVFVAAAPIEVILRDCTTTDAENRLFIPQELYPRVMSRLAEALDAAAAEFVLNQSDEFLLYVVRDHADALVSMMRDGVDPLGSHWGMQIYGRIINDLNTQFEAGRECLEDNLEYAVWEMSCSEALHHEDYENPLDPQVVRSCILGYRDELGRMLEQLVCRATEQVDDRIDAADVLEEIEVFESRLEAAAEKVLTPAEYLKMLRFAAPLFEEAKQELGDYLDEMDAMINSQIKARQEADDDDSYEPRIGIFSDVDK